MYTIDIIDDHEIYCKGLTQLLKAYNPTITVRQWNSPVDLLVQMNKKNYQPPYLAIIDYKMPVLLGCHISLYFQKKFPQVKKMGISSEVSTHWIEDFIVTGCSGFIYKGDNINDIMATIDGVLQNGYCYNLYFTSRMVNALQPLMGKYNFADGLNYHEYMFIHLCQTEFSKDSIAQYLNISPSLVHKIDKELHRKYNVHTKQSLVHTAQQKGIIKMYGG